MKFILTIEMPDDVLDAQLAKEGATREQFRDVMKDGMKELMAGDGMPEGTTVRIEVIE